jgi:hypothetical protein
LACVYHHLANGTLDLWNYLGHLGIASCSETSHLGLHRLLESMLGIVGLSALGGAKMIKPEEARAIEDKMNRARIESGEIAPNDEKLAK